MSGWEESVFGSVILTVRNFPWLHDWEKLIWSVGITALEVAVMCAVYGLVCRLIRIPGAHKIQNRYKDEKLGKPGRGMMAVIALVVIAINIFISIGD